MNVNILIAILAPIFVARLPLCAVATDTDPALPSDGITWDLSTDYIRDNSVNVPSTQIDDKYYSVTGLTKSAAPLAGASPIIQSWFTTCAAPVCAVPVLTAAHRYGGKPTPDAVPWAMTPSINEITCCDVCVELNAQSGLLQLIWVRLLNFDAWGSTSDLAAEQHCASATMRGSRPSGTAMSPPSNLAIVSFCHTRRHRRPARHARFIDSNFRVRLTTTETDTSDCFELGVFSPRFELTARRSECY